MKTFQLDMESPDLPVCPKCLSELDARFEPDRLCHHCGLCWYCCQCERCENCGERGYIQDTICSNCGAQHQEGQD